MSNCAICDYSEVDIVAHCPECGCDYMMNERYKKLSAKLDKAETALRKIHTYRSDCPDWNMVMAIAGDYLEPMEAVLSEQKGPNE